MIDNRYVCQFHYYRFSISWTRILINGTQINQKGITYYNNVINELIANNIEAIVTIYHYDLPQHIQDLGGFTNPLFIKYYEHYANILFKYFGDRVKRWITFNEPFNLCVQGYGMGRMAPGIKSSGVGEYLCMHHVLQAHAVAYHLYKDSYFKKQRGEIGIVLSSSFFFPKDETVDEGFIERVLQYRLGWSANPIFSKDGGYPKIMVDDFDMKAKRENSWSRLPKMDNEMKMKIRGTADFFALNYYTSSLVKMKSTPSSKISFDDDTFAEYSFNETWKKGKSKWIFNVPEGFYNLIKWISERYANPRIFISENGYSDDGNLNDEYRITYIKSHLGAISKAIRNGYNVEAYTVWSLIDNFEWNSGFTEFFGIYAINRTRYERVPKKSVYFFKNLLANLKNKKVPTY